MAKSVLVALSRPVEGRDAEYNRWYDEVHLPEVCDIPGITGGRRYDRSPLSMGEGSPYMAIYDIEADDPATVLKELVSRVTGGKMTMSDAIDRASTVMWIYTER